MGHWLGSERPARLAENLLAVRHHSTILVFYTFQHKVYKGNCKSNDLSEEERQPLLSQVALAQAVYLWNSDSGAITELCQLQSEDDYVSSLKFVKEGGNYLSVGTSQNTVQLWDVEAGKQLRTMRGHAARVSSLDWNDHILSSGGRDSTILHHDVRVAQHRVATLKGHTQALILIDTS